MELSQHNALLPTFAEVAKGLLLHFMMFPISTMTRPVFLSILIVRMGVSVLLDIIAPLAPLNRSHVRIQQYAWRCMVEVLTIADHALLATFVMMEILCHFHVALDIIALLERVVWLVPLDAIIQDC